MESSSVSQVSYIEKTYLQRVTSLFSVEILFVSQCRKTSEVNPSVLCFSTFPVAINFFEKKVRRGFEDFPLKTSVSKCRVISQGNPSVLCFEISSGENVHG